MQLIHPFPSAVVVVTSFGLLVVAHGAVPSGSIVARALALVALSQIAVGSLNDLHDRESDLLTQCEKPIPSGLVSPRFTRYTIAISLALLAVLAASFGLFPGAVALAGTMGGIAYDLWLKPTPFSVVGYAVGFLSLLTFIWSVAGHVDGWFVLAYPAGALVVLAAHLAQSLPDLESDTVHGQRGLAASLGPARSLAGIFVPYAVVLLGGAVLAARSANVLSVVTLVVSILLGGAALRMAKAALNDRRARVTLFHLMGPALAVLGIGCLLAVRSL